MRFRNFSIWISVESPKPIVTKRRRGKAWNLLALKREERRKKSQMNDAAHFALCIAFVLLHYTAFNLLRKCCWMHRRSQGGPRNLAYLVILCFEKQRPKQKHCCSPKVKHFAPTQISGWLHQWLNVHISVCVLRNIFHCVIVLSKRAFALSLRVLGLFIGVQLQHDEKARNSGSILSW